jgi:hypothetical protein
MPTFSHLLNDLSDVSLKVLERHNRSSKLSTSTPNSDNEVAESMVKRLPDHQGSKHMDISYRFVRGHYERCTVNVEHISKRNNWQTS